MQEAMKIKPLTEEQILSVCKYFDDWDKWRFTESQIRMLYWRMKAQWTKLDRAEEQIEKLKKRKAESYRRNKEQEFNEHLKAYKQETAWDIWKYELMKLNERENWRTLVVWIMWNYDVERQKQRRVHAVEIEERQNPAYFQEIIKRFSLVID